MALAFFFAEIGTGLFVVSMYLNHLFGMVAGLAVVAILKPYFHLAHMGVPKKSWRALTRPDRSWISRGAIAIGVLVAFGGLHVLDRAFAFGLPPKLETAIAFVAVAAGLIVMCYQGFAMAASESFALWASPLVPLASLLYATTAGVLLGSVLGANTITESQSAALLGAGQILLIADLLVVAGILVFARQRSKGGAFSVALLMRGQYVLWFRNLVLIVGLALPLLLLLTAGNSLALRIVACVAMLTGFYAFRITMFRAAVYEPVVPGFAGSIGLSTRS